MKDKIREAIHHITKPEITQDDLNAIYFTLIELHREVLRGSIPDEGNSEQARSNNAIMILISKAEHIYQEAGSRAINTTHFSDENLNAVASRDAAERALRHFTTKDGSISFGLEHLLDAACFASEAGVEL